MRVLVTGGRDFSSHEQRMWLYAGLDMLDQLSGGILEIIEGGARGADLAAKNWVHWKKSCSSTRIMKLTTVEAEWEKYSAGLKHGQKNPAGMIRNEQMAAMMPDVVLACPGGNGTAHMVECARRRGIKVIFLEKMPVTKGAPVSERPSDPTFAPAS